MKNLIKTIAIIGIASSALSCKTTAVKNSNASAKEYKADSLQKRDSSFTKEVILIENTPASINTIETIVVIDSNGLQPFFAQIISQTDTLKISGQGKKIYAQSNCSERERIYKETISSLKRELEKSKQHHTSDKEMVYEKQEVIVNKTPILVWVLIGFLACIIVYLLIKISIK